MLSQTLMDGLEQYRIGPKLRRLRLKKSMGLVQLGEHSGLSPALLSKIERGQIFPTLPTLLRIALVFGVGLEHFFSDTQAGPLIKIVRKTDRVPMPDQKDAASPAYIFESLDFPVPNRKMEAYVAEFPADGPPSKPHHHAGMELVYVLKGRMKIAFSETEIVLSEGDAVTFDGTAAHTYARESRGAAAIITVVTA